MVNFMKRNLAFKNKYIEQEFINYQLHFKEMSFTLLTAALVFESMGMFFLNPLDFDLFKLAYIMPFSFTMLATISSFLIIKKWFPLQSEKGICIYVSLFMIGSIEFVSQIQKSKDLDLWVYFLLGINIQTGCLFLLMSRIRWTRSLLIITVTHIYSWLRLINIYESTGAQKVAFLSLVINIFLTFGLTFWSEKDERINFQKLRMNKEELIAYEEIIKNVIQSAIIIMSQGKVLFFNETTKKMFEIENRDQVLETIQITKIIQNKGIFDLHSSNDFLCHREPKTTKKTPLTLYDLYEDMEALLTEPSKNIFDGFKAIEGVVEMIGDEPKCLSIQLGASYWKGSKSILIVMNDMSSIQNHYKNIDAYKDNLLATVSHDLRTPLNGILGMLEILYEEIEDPTKKEKLLISKTSAKLLINMINDILDFSMISKGRLRLKFQKANISALVEETVSLLSLQAHTKGLILEIENSLLKSENHIIDSDRLRQVLLNLIENAIKFTNQGRIVVRIKEEPINSDAVISVNEFASNPKLDRVEDFEIINQSNGSYPKSGNTFMEYSSMKLSKQRIIFEVEDTGIGIKPKEIKKLFKLFSRVSNEQNTNMGGVGLGLAISQSLVTLMNHDKEQGKIKVISEYGKGSKFIFPIYIEHTEQSNDFKEFEEDKNSPLIFDANSQKFIVVDDPVPLTQENYESSPLIIVKRPKFVLVVDDDQINLLVASTYLKSLENEFRFVTAVNGKDAINKVIQLAKNNQYFDLLLMDCNMPVMDGYEASQQLKGLMKNNEIPWAPIIAITANITAADKEKCLNSGMDLFLAKPYLKTQLLQKIQEASEIQLKHLK